VRPTIQLWFGSSGGGLPRRSELNRSERFLVHTMSFCLSVALATSRGLLHPIQVLRY
jgi:hypothetical protein